MLRVLSLGAGVQSTTLALMAAWRGTKRSRSINLSGPGLLIGQKGNRGSCIGASNLLTRFC
jgi:hypothetical protein